MGRTTGRAGSAKASQQPAASTVGAETAVSADAAFPSDGDAPMPTVENRQRYLFTPSRECSILDVFEICMSFMLTLTQSKVVVAPGTMRHLLMDAARYDQLSESARRFMTVEPNALDAPAGPVGEEAA